MADINKPAILHNLVTPMSSFIGRERDISWVKKSLVDHRLVTLTGSGGCGKTRLAYQVAGELITAYEQGVWLVEFAPLSDPLLIPQTVASALGLRERQDAELSQTVYEHLSSRHALIVFDNCEHLIADIARFVDKILQICPHLSVLATSREGLGIPGEAIWAVPPLSLPAQQPWTDPASAQEAANFYLKSESVQLFIARVSPASPGFSLTAENGPWVAEICRRLDGMPLAIELAAARARALSVKQIAERLDDRFGLLTAGSRTAPPRQQTLAATLDWSYALLGEPERRVLQRLSVFAGGATLEAAEAVCACEHVRPAEVLDVLSHLVDKSLVVADHSSSETRYRLLETIRQYAGQKLSEQGDEKVCKDSHLAYFVHWAEEMAPTLDGQNKLKGLEEYENEHDNLRAALDWCSSNGNKAKAGLQLATACGRFWRLHGHVSEGRRRFSIALSPKLVQDRSSLHARALYYSALLAYLQGDYPAAQPMIEESLTIWRELGQEGLAMLGHTLLLLGDLKNEVGDYSGALPVFHEALQIFSQLNDKKGIGWIHMQLGWEAMRIGDYLQAQNHLEKYLTLSQETGDMEGLIYALSGLGEVAVRLGQVNRASDLLRKSLSLSRDQGDKWGEATILGSLGWIALRQRDFDLMRQLLNDSLALRMEIGDKGGMAWCLEKLAEAAFREGEYQKAAKIFGSAASLRIPIHSAIDQVDLPDYERTLVGLRSRLDQETFTQCWNEGTAMRLKDVIACALSGPAVRMDEPSISDKEKFQGLSKRERETAAWIAQGKSNREIAQAMTVGEKTVETYVTRILDKLGVNSRVQIATWAVEKGLISMPKQ